MKIFNCEQKSPEWYAARLGVPSASSFDKIFTATGKKSTSAKAYRHSLIAEIATGAVDGIEQSPWVSRGNELEDAARAWYELEHGVDVEEVGFVLTDFGYGCSPDGLVGDDGLLEIKCPKPSTHVGYALAGKLPSTYVPQVQGQMLVMDREWCDFISYLPGAAPFIARVERDHEYTEALHEALVEFVDKLREELDAYRNLT